MLNGRLDADPVVDGVLKTDYCHDISQSSGWGDVGKQELDLVQFPPASRHKRAQVRRRSFGARFSCALSGLLLDYATGKLNRRDLCVEGLACDKTAIVSGRLQFPVALLADPTLQAARM